MRQVKWGSESSPPHHHPPFLALPRIFRWFSICARLAAADGHSTEQTGGRKNDRADRISQVYPDPFSSELSSRLAAVVTYPYKMG